MIGLHMSSEQRILPLLPTEIAAYCQLTQTKLSAADVKSIIRMDALYRSIVGQTNYAKPKREASIDDVQGIKDVFGIIPKKGSK